MCAALQFGDMCTCQHCPLALLHVLCGMCFLLRCFCMVAAETLFFGRQDAMQRTTLLPLSDFIRSRGLDPATMTVAEVGCGTGRFHTFIKVGVVLLDLIK